MVNKTENDLNTVPIASNRKLLTCLVSGLTLLSVAIMLVFVDPVLVFAKWKMRAKEGSLVHEFLKKEQLEGIIISAYLFNITNEERFLNGEDHKLKVEEVGPFSYQELRTNEELELDEEAGEIRYSPRVDMVFQPEMSIGNPENINITVPNLPMLGMAAQISTYPYITRMAFSLLLSQLKSLPVVTMSVQKYMWGYQDPLLTLGNNLVPGIINFNKIGILDMFCKNSPKNRLVVSAKDEDKFMIKSRNEHKKLNMGSGDPDDCEKCDSFEDTYEGLLYPLPFAPKTKLRLFKEGLCKVWNMIYNETRILDTGVEGLVFKISDSFYNMGSNDTYAGLADFSACFFGIPVSLSKGHLLDVNPELYERIDGMKPDANKHNGYLIVDPMMGVGVATYFVVQFNLVLGDLSYNSKASKFSNMVLPVGNIVMKQPELTEENKGFTRLMNITAPIILLCTKLTLFFLSLVLIGYSIRIVCCQWNYRETYQESEQAKRCVEEPLMGKAKS